MLASRTCAIVRRPLALVKGMRWRICSDWCRRVALMRIWILMLRISYTVWQAVRMLFQRLLVDLLMLAMQLHAVLTCRRLLMTSLLS